MSTVWYRVVKDLNNKTTLERKITKTNETPEGEAWFEGSYKGKIYQKPSIFGYVIPKDIIIDLLSIEWDLLYRKDFSDMNDKKFLFLKKDLVINHIAKYRGESSVLYVGQNDADFILSKNNVLVECKTQLSSSMYNKNKNLKDKLTIKVYDSHGTNSLLYPDQSKMADIFMIVMKDGVFAVSRDTVWSNCVRHGDGFRSTISSDYIVEITGLITVTEKIKMNTRERIKKILAEVV